MIEKDGMDVTVRYIDYGNKERVHISKVHRLAIMFTKLPMQAMNCGVAGKLGQGHIEKEVLKEQFCPAYLNPKAFKEKISGSN